MRCSIPIGKRDPVNVILYEVYNNFIYCFTWLFDDVIILYSSIIIIVLYCIVLYVLYKAGLATV